MTRSGALRRFCAIALGAAVPVSLAAVAVPHAFSNGTLASAAQVNENFLSITGRLDVLEQAPSTAIVRDSDTSPTVCMRLKLKPGLHQFLYQPVDCTTGAELGLSQSGDGVWQVGAGGTRLSCLDYYDRYPATRTVNGKYLIDADGVGATFGPQKVYCDMTGGGFTRAAVISAGGAEHHNVNAVSPDNVAEGTTGKLSDAMINALVTSTLKVLCGSGDAIKGNSCIFRSNSAVGGTACFGDTNADARGINESGTADNTYYGYAGYNGCHNGNLDLWSQAGTLWVK